MSGREFEILKYSLASFRQSFTVTVVGLVSLFVAAYLGFVVISERMASELATSLPARVPPGIASLVSSELLKLMHTVGLRVIWRTFPWVLMVVLLVDVSSFIWQVLAFSLVYPDEPGLWRYLDLKAASNRRLVLPFAIGVAGLLGVVLIWILNIVEDQDWTQQVFRVIPSIIVCLTAAVCSGDIYMRYRMGAFRFLAMGFSRFSRLRILIAEVGGWAAAFGVFYASIGILQAGLPKAIETLKVDYQELSRVCLDLLVSSLPDSLIAGKGDSLVAATLARTDLGELGPWVTNLLEAVVGSMIPVLWASALVFVCVGFFLPLMLVEVRLAPLVILLALGGLVGITWVLGGDYWEVLGLTPSGLTWVIVVTALAWIGGEILLQVCRVVFGRENVRCPNCSEETVAIGLFCTRCGSSLSKVEAPFIGVFSTKRVHRRGCYYVGRGRKAKLVEYRDLDAARVEGFVPCKICRPDGSFEAKFSPSEVAL